MKIYFGSDHAGSDLKGKLLPFVSALGFEVSDLDKEHSPEDDYPDFIAPVAKAVSTDEGSRGIILGGSGEGEEIVANRFPGIRAVEYYGKNLEIIRLSREHNDANVLSLGARFLSEYEAKEAVKLWLTTKFSGEERHKRRIEKIDEIK